MYESMLHVLSHECRGLVLDSLRSWKRKTKKYPQVVSS